MPSILFVLTSHSEFKSGKPTGWYLPECAHPYYVLKKAGYKIVAASPKGGKPPLDPASVEMFKEDEESVKFLNGAEEQAFVKNTLKLADVKQEDYAAVFVVGGHGPVFDLAVDPIAATLFESFWTAAKPVAAVCHGPAAFHSTKVDGKPLFAGRKATCFSNVEEEQVGLVGEIPFLPEDDIKALGGEFVNAREPWGVEVVVDSAHGGTLITGANPSSAGPTAEAILAALAR